MGGRGTAGQHAPVASWKAHDGAVTALTFYRHLEDTPEQPPIKLATAGAPPGAQTPACQATLYMAAPRPIIHGYAPVCGGTAGGGARSRKVVRGGCGGRQGRTRRWCSGTRTAGSSSPLCARCPRATWTPSCSAATAAPPLARSPACCWPARSGPPPRPGKRCRLNATRRLSGWGAAAPGPPGFSLPRAQERAALWGLHPATGQVTQLIAMEHLIPPGHKKVPKVYAAACHPTLPHLLAVAANSGAAPAHFRSPVLRVPSDTSD